MTQPRHVTLHTSDGVRLAAALWDADAGVACVVAHGFTGS